MGRTATLAFVSLHNSLVNLPLSIHGPLVERGIPPQSLVVELSFTPPGSSKKPASTIKSFVGWTGMPSQVVGVTNQVRGGAPLGERLEMDPQHAAMIGGLVEGMQVSIELLRDLPAAASVALTPLTPDDWEILETNAEFVEMYMLNQVRAVKSESVIGCWVNGSTLVRFTVDSTEPASAPALLLNSSSELHVAPRPRGLPSASASAASKSHDLAATPSPSSSSSSASNPAFEALGRQLIRLLPLEVEFVPREEGGVGQSEAVAYVSTELYRDAKAALPSLRCSLMHHARPNARGAGAGGGGGGADKDKEAAGGSEKDKEGKGAGKDKERDEAKRVEVKVKEWKGIPVGHIWVGDNLRKELGVAGDQVGAFELLRLAPPLSAAAKKAKLKEQEKAEASGITSPTSNGSSSRTKQHLSPRTVPSSLQHAGLDDAVPTIMAGVDDQLTAIRNHVVHSLASAAIQHVRTPALGVLVTGSSGAGKTALVKQITKELECDSRSLTHTIYIDCSKFADERLPVLKTKMKDWFDEACWHAPSVLVLDNLDRLLGAEVEHADSFPALHLAHTFMGLATPALASRPIILLATAQSSAALHPLLSTTHLLGESVSLRGPGKTARRDILSLLVKTKTTSSNLTAPGLNYATVAGMTEGYLPADLRDLVGRAVHQAAKRAPIASEQGLELQLDDFTAAQIDFVPLSLRDVKLQKSEVQWADIGGLHETRRVLRETLEWPTKYGAIFASCPLRLRSGLLLYGFPGCGKTLLASAVAKECGLNFISVKGPEILNKYIGASEKSVRDLFERAQAAKPCILFFDEFDSIAPKRGHDSTGVTDRVVNQMLTQMDGAEGLDGVYVLAATSRPDLIDPALLRPGRLDKSLLCDMPNHDDRLEIMQACARKIALSPSVDLSAYAAQTQGFSGADLQALIYNAHLDAIHAGLSAVQSEAESSPSSNKEEAQDISYTSFGGGVETEKVLSRAEQAVVTKRLELIMGTLAEGVKATNTQSVTPSSRPVTHVADHHLEKALQATRPSVPAAELHRLRRIYSEFVSGRSEGGLPSGEPSDEVGGRSSLM